MDATDSSDASDCEADIMDAEDMAALEEEMAELGRAVWTTVKVGWCCSPPLSTVPAGTMTQ